MLANTVFLIMAAIVMWRHKKKQTPKMHMEAKHIKSWLKAIVSLVVVMGLTWAVGLLVVAVKELVPLAYIYTIMVAFQGVWIFIIFVGVDKKVREEYTKMWKSQIKESGLFTAKTTSSANVVCHNSFKTNLLRVSLEIDQCMVQCTACMSWKVWSCEAACAERSN